MNGINIIIAVIVHNSCLLYFVSNFASANCKIINSKQKGGREEKRGRKESAFYEFPIHIFHVYCRNDLDDNNSIVYLLTESACEHNALLQYVSMSIRVA